MWKQLLAYTLVFCMAFETPATAYAAEQNVLTETVSEYGYELTESEASSDELEDSVENPKEEPGEGNEEESDLEEDGTSEETDEDGTDMVGDETDDDDGQETDMPDYNNGDAEAGDSESDTDESGDGDSDEETVIGEDSDTMETESEADVEADTDKEALVSVQAVAAGITELDYEEASSAGVEVYAPYDSGNAQWYSFTAPKDGNYLFYTDEQTEYGNYYYYTYVDLYDTNQNYFRAGYFYDGRYLNLVSGDMTEGETVYLRMYSETAGGKTFTLKIAEQTAPELTGNGSSTVTVGDGIDMTVTPTPGYKWLKVNVKLTNTGEQTNYETYQIYTLCQNVDTDNFDNMYSYVSLYNPDTDWVINVDMGSRYILYYAIRNSEGGLIKFFTGTEQVTTGTTSEGVHIHESECDEHSITLNVEPIGNNYMYCYYAPEDGSEEEKKFDYGIYRWDTITIRGLKSGTSYVVRFCNNLGGIEYARETFTTLGEPAAVSSVDYKAELSSDFTTLTLSAEVAGYTGESSYADFHYRFVDALGVERVGSERASLTNNDGNVNLEITLEDNKAAAFLADSEYDIEMWLSFPNDYLTLDAKTCQVKTPEALYSSDDIGFVIKDNDTNSSPGMTFEVTVKGELPQKDSIIFYRPLNSLEYTSVKYGVNTGIYSDSTMKPGDYEVVLFIGGVKIEKTWQVRDTSGLSLTKVDSGKNEDGSYDFVRTLKAESNGELTDTYYLHLAYSTESMGYYSVVDSSMELEPENGYQATVYSAELSDVWLQPDADYYLRWTLSKSSYSNSSASDAIYAYYEKIHTKPANIDVESVESTSSTQEFKITLDSAEVVNMKANNRYLSLAGYIKKSDVGENAYDPMGWCTLSPSNNYSETIRLYNLEADTSYDLSLRDDRYGNTVYKTLSFTTAGDSRTLSKPEAIVTASSTVLKTVFSGNTGYKQSYVHFFYKAVDEQNWTKADSINVSSYVTRNCSVTLTNLARGTNYKYVIVLSEQADFNDPDSVKTEGWKVTDNFETLPIEAPKSITLSQTELYLNAAYSNIEGSGRKQLKAVVAPNTAEQELEWASSDSRVAEVSSNGLVTAVSTGEAIITVKSLYAKEGEKSVSAECKVVVGNYRVGFTTDENSDVVLVDTLQIYKGKATEEKYILYQIDENDKSVTLSSSSFSVDSTNEQVVTWQDGVITAGNAGSAKLVFMVSEGKEAGVCTYLPVSVSAQGKGFDILRFDSNSTRYPAIKEDAAADGSAQYTLAYSPGITYTAVGEISPYEGFNKTDFKWELTDESGNETTIASVSSPGVITPAKAGIVRLTVTASKSGAEYYDKTRTIILNFKELPKQVSTGTAEIYALANISNKIGDVDFPADFADEETNKVYWKWKYPDTPLVTNGINTDSYPFEAVYQGEEFYPCETTVNVYIAKVTGMSVIDDHSKVVETRKEGQTADTMTLTVTTAYQGSLNTLGYSEYKVEMPKIQGITIEPIEPDDNNVKGIYQYKITAEKAGNYTLKPAIQVEYKDGSGNTKTKALASTAYKIKAVDQAQAVSITLTSDTDAVKWAIADQNKVVIDTADESAIKTFKLQAEVTGRNGEPLNSTLVWKTTDSSVAAVNAATGAAHEATVTVKGEGHAVLTVAAKDDASYASTTLRIEIQNHAPRVNVSKVNVNTAYDYNSSSGLSFAAASSGAVEIVPVYGESIRNVAIYEENNREVESTGFKAYQNGMYQWVIGPSSNGSLTNGTYKCILRVTTSRAEPYDYPMTVSVTEKRAKLTAKAYNTVNLFYTSEYAGINLNISGINSGIQSVNWNGGTGFAYFYYSSISSTQKRLYFRQDNIQLKNGKLADPNDAKGTLTIYLYGYKEPYTISNMTLKWNYKKPSVVTQNASTTLIPSAGKNRNRFYLYNKTEKRSISYDPGYSSVYYYNEAVCGNENVSLSPSGYYVYYDYNGNKSTGSEKIKLTLMSSAWRESVEATHTIKFATPTAYLTYPTVTVNTTQIGTAYTAIMIKNAYDASMSCDDIVIEGKDRKAQDLLDKDLLEITQNYGYQINIKQNRARTMAQTQADSNIKDGTYTYKVTPYYTDDQGTRKALNTLTLKVKATSKEVSAKTKTSGSLDLVQESSTSYNYVWLSPVFSNIGNAYYVSDMELCGEYSEYFDLTGYEYSSLGQAYLTIADDSKLKSGQKYKLSVKYTVQMSLGDSFTVMGAPFTVKPKQTAPKVTISNNNQVLYASADNVSRTYTLSLPNYRYTIESVSGSLDCNKDDKADITVSGTTGSYYSNLTVRITDRDGVITSTNAKGKTYSIPVVLRLKGTDGISKDVKTTIKVTVKR